MKKRNEANKSQIRGKKKNHKGNSFKRRQIKKGVVHQKESTKPLSHKKVTAISEDDLTGMMRIRYLLGKIFETVQYLEYNLSLSLRYSLIIKSVRNISKPITTQSMQVIMNNVEQTLKNKKIDLHTFGNLISTLSENHVLEKSDLDELEEILQTRNILAHQYFKRNRFEEQEKNKAFLDGQANYLSHFQNRVMNFNDRICSLLNSYANQISKLK